MKWQHMILWSVAVPIIGTADVVIALWDFGSDIAGYSTDVTVDHAVGTPMLTGMSAGISYDTNGQAGVSFMDVDGAIHNAGQALAWGSGVNDGNQEWMLRLNLTGYTGINIRWDYRSTGTGPTHAVFDYRIDSGNWTWIDEVVLENDSTFHTYGKDLASITAINNYSDVQFRLSGFTGGSGSGTHRFDNLQIAAIPEPAVIGFIALTSLAALVAKRFLV